MKPYALLFLFLVASNALASDLTLNCRTVSDVIPANVDKDGRLYITATIRTDGELNDVTFRIPRASQFGTEYIATTGVIKYQPIALPGHIPSEDGEGLYDSYMDVEYAFALTLPKKLTAYSQRLDTWSARISILENPTIGGFATEYEIRCAMTQ